MIEKDSTLNLEGVAKLPINVQMLYAYKRNPSGFDFDQHSLPPFSIEPLGKLR